MRTVRPVVAAAIALMVYAVPLHAQENLFTVTDSAANVHSAPTIVSPVVGTAARGRTFEVTRNLGSWVRVAWPDAAEGVGYVHISRGTFGREGAPRVAVASPSTSAPAQIGQPERVAAPANVLLPSHVLGLGGRMGIASSGTAIGARVWTRGPLGLQIEAGRATHSTALTTSTVGVKTFGSTAIVALPDSVTNAAWVKPFVGAGIHMHRSRLNLAPGSSSVANTGTAYHMLGGAEVTLAAVPQLGISAELRRTWAPEPFTGFDLGGTGLSLSAHWYIR